MRVRRLPDRASYDHASVAAILDAGLIAHVGTVRNGSPVVLPMFYVRDGESLLLHGAPAAGTLRRGDAARNDGVDVCVTVTLIDGLVLARSAFHHSLNYRSVVVIGRAEVITDQAEKEAALHLFVDGLVPGRQADLRPNSKSEIQGTSVLRLSLDHASTKIRTGPPIDEDSDYELPIWGGVVALRTSFGGPESDSRNLPGVEIPANVLVLSRSEFDR